MIKFSSINKIGDNMKFKITQNESGISVNEFLRKNQNFSRRIVSRAKFENAISVNGENVFTSYILKENDILCINFSQKQSPHVIAQDDLELDILYEDEHILAVNKPPFMPPHPSKGHPDSTLANAVLGYYKKCQTNTAVRILGRLDKNTSGVVIICKNEYSGKLMNETEVSKKYCAICHGEFEKAMGIINLPIEREALGSVKRVCRDDGKPSSTEYEVVFSKNGFSFVRLNLLTGRTHQIRVHLSHINHPIVGDDLYGGNETIINRQALHAREISFIHPISQVPMTIIAPLPHDMLCVLKDKLSISSADAEKSV